MYIKAVIKAGHILKRGGGGFRCDVLHPALWGFKRNRFKQQLVAIVDLLCAKENSWFLNYLSGRGWREIKRKVIV